MLEEVYSGIYLNRIPLIGSPLKELNSYIIPYSGDRVLIIDLGLGRQECVSAMVGGLSELGLRPENADVFLTHKHSDHSGLAGFMAESGSRIFISWEDGLGLDHMRSEKGLKTVWEHVINYSIGGSIKDFEELITLVSPTGETPKYIPVEEGFLINAGDFEFTVVAFPGHTQGHCGLYEKRKKLLFCGDHILDKISPNICFIKSDTDILGAYLESLEKASRMDVKYLFPAHRKSPENYGKRISELYEHHMERLKEIENKLPADWISVSEVASSMNWDIKGSWESFTFIQRFFASSEAVAHLEHLYMKNRICHKVCNGRFYYKA